MVGSDLYRCILAAAVFIIIYKVWCAPTPTTPTTRYPSVRSRRSTGSTRRATVASTTYQAHLAEQQGDTGAAAPVTEEGPSEVEQITQTFMNFQKACEVCDISPCHDICSNKDVVTYCKKARDFHTFSRVPCPIKEPGIYSNEMFAWEPWFGTTY